ncbi:hypothetical protein ACH4A8_39025 [Streptomyces vietnamensis]|uniref:hypothetical protein n=1 Tax=Streptomyces vietnamensis TaxID=362257 RepID=UPI00378A3EF8
MSAREELFRRVAGAFVDEKRANKLIDDVIAERDAQIVAWLRKKAYEYGYSNRVKRTQADAVSCMASKLSRGAVRDTDGGMTELARLTTEVDTLQARITELETERDAHRAAYDCTCIDPPELDSGKLLHSSYCASLVAAEPSHQVEDPAAEWRRIEAERPEAGVTHRCGIPLTRRLDCGHCPHEICEDCERCPHSCRCGTPVSVPQQRGEAR